jgi:O-antigen ligase
MYWWTAAIIFILPAYLVRFTVAGIPTTLLEVLIYLAAVVLLTSQPLLLTSQRLKALVLRYRWPLLLILIGSIIGLIVAPDLRDSLGLFKAYILDPILFFGVVGVGLNFTEEQRSIDSLMAAMVALGISLALSGLLITSVYTPDGRALGVFVLDPTASPNFLALLLAPLAAFAAALVLFGSNRAVQLWGILGYVMMTAGLIATGSRGGMLAAGLATALSIGLFILRRVKKNLRPVLRAVTAFALLVVVIAAGWFARPNFGAGANQRTTSSNNIRYEIWRTTVVDILPKTALLGVGLGNYQRYFTDATQHRVNFPEYIAPWARTPHNFFLTIWTNLGLAGIVGFIWLIVLFYDNLRRSKHRYQPFIYGLGFAMLAMLLHGMVDAVYWKNDLAVLFWLLIALSHVMQREDDDDKTA